MANYFVVNKKRYKAPAFDFNTVCDFEEAGISLTEAAKKPTSMIRMYFALLFDGDKEKAGKELEQHMIDGGTFEDLTDAMVKEMNESHFFQALNKNAKTEDPGEEETEKETESKSRKR